MLRSFITGLAAFAIALGAQAQTIKIAILGPMAFVQGENHWAGAEMARDEINKAGGINVGGKRMQVELIRADTNEIQSVPDATNAIERVITRDKADFLIGGFRSEAVLAMQEVAMDHKKIFLGAGAAHSKLGQNVEENYNRYKYWFRYTPTKDIDLARTLFAVMGSIAQQIRTELKTETPKVALLAEKAVWTGGLIAAAQKNLPAMKMEVVGLWQPSATATDVTAELAAIDRAGAQIVFTMLSGPVGIVVGRQMGERNMKAVAWGINVEGQKEEFWQATAGKAQFVSTLDTYAEVEMTPRTIPFVRAFKERYKKMPTYNAATYDAIIMLKSVIEKENTLDADKLVAAIEKVEHVGTGSIVTFDKRHDLVWAVGKTAGIAVQWQDGKKVPFWPPQVKGMQPFKLPAR
ncbi:MAG TPA: ABC transporter substrate-binding protein [Burkholderiales bacterium]|jgi:branched-chain amino acid transport system substrate-binding protein|nr:ABC transporter substrate-binding protein [Burkholderiales bacterium]HSA68900.1 ABC transporter substrate-binding protein [Burkholderiales bacterium]